MDCAVVYYSDGHCDKRIRQDCWNQLNKVAPGPIIPVTTFMFDLSKEFIQVNYPRSGAAIIAQILLGLNATDAKFVFLAEHDVMYPASHFEHRALGYNLNLYYLTKKGFFKAPRKRTLSCMCGPTDLMQELFFERQKSMGHELEPKLPLMAAGWESTEPVVDIRHGRNWTGDRKSETYLTSLTPWELHYAY